MYRKDQIADSINRRTFMHSMKAYVFAVNCTGSSTTAKIGKASTCHTERRETNKGWRSIGVETKTPYWDRAIERKKSTNGVLGSYEVGG